MFRRLTIRLHDCERIVMQADGPEDAIAFDGFGELLCLPVETDGGEGAPDVELVEAGKIRRDGSSCATRR